ncbi:MAG: hypothetical protein L0211_13720 [Planctomycetaceae bacterium]|nr:hypothetical protein [Planctomycetaceae bacterium]
MCLEIHNIFVRAAALRAIFASSVLCTGIVALLAMLLAAPAQAQPPVGPTDVAAAEKIGVTLYQASGLHGKIPMKKVYKVDPSGDTGSYVLEFASANMNTKMDFQAKFVVPAGMVFKSFEVFMFNGNVNVTPGSADSWDGQTIIDKVTVSPWNMNHVLEQCIAQLTNPDGTFKDSATFDLQADVTELVRGKGIAAFPNAPPGSASSYSAQVKPRTRVVAYIVEESRKSEDSREIKRLSSDRPAARLPGSPSARPGRPAPSRDTGSGASGAKPKFDAQVLPARPRMPQPPSSGVLSGGSSRTAAKEQFDRKKPHVNVP